MATVSHEPSDALPGKDRRVAQLVVPEMWPSLRGGRDGRLPNAPPRHRAAVGLAARRRLRHRRGGDQAAAAAGVTRALSSWVTSLIDALASPKSIAVFGSVNSGLSTPA
jgi:hypothetical protein